ncbi:MAG: hypothetical protein AAFQ43_00515, partial [Bacteroidota bacterium]
MSDERTDEQRPASDSSGGFCGVLLRQHIATKRAAVGWLKGKYDYDERVTVGEVVRTIEDLRFEEVCVEVCSPADSTV